jgi:N12 class adenine-specific DNA methylase
VRQKASDNVSALRLLKGIEAEDRFATPDEAQALASFVGWGGMPRIFKEYDYGPEADYWQERHTELKELLTPEEYEAAKASVTNAHFTREEVIREMWGRLADWGGDRRMRVLEPSMGVGNFISARPSMFQATQVTGVELDPVTGRIAKRLFPSANIHVGGFEATPIPNNYFDVAISNVPFGPYGVSDPRFRDEPFLTKRIHNYFFAKALDKVRPGGVVAFITSHYTLDAKDPAFREYIAERAWLVGAARLPASTFQRNANTAVTTDIVFLQKRVEGQERPAWAAPDTWATVIPQEGYRDAYGRAVEPFLNSYFVDNPRQVLGDLKIGDGTGGPDELTVGGDFDAAALRRALGRIGEPQLLVPPETAPPPPPVATADELRRMKPGNLAVRDRGVWQLQPDGTYAEAGLPKTAVKAAEAWIPIRDAARDVIANQLERGTDAELARAQKALNKAYDGFVQKHGPIHGKAAQAMADDPDFPLTLALEDWKPPQYRKEGRKRTLVAEGKATKRDIFSKRTVAGYEPPSSAESTQQAYGISLAESGAISTDRVASLLKTTPSDALRRLLDEGFAYEDPAHGGELFTAEEYLSGDVVDKLEHAQAATTLEPERFRRNVAALEAVQPTPLSPAEVTVQLGASWVPAEDYAAFAGVELGGGRPGNVRVKHSEGLGIFRVDWDHQVTYSAAATTTYGTAAMNALELFEAGMNLRTPVVYKGSGDDRVVDDEATALARDKLDQIKEKFQSWIFSDPDRASRLIGTYNRQFNNQRLRSPDGSHLVFPGMNRSVLRGGDLEPHQKNDVWRILTQPNTLVAEPVGSGKTWTLVAALMEARRMGHVKKPVLAVPNAVFEQWGEEWRRLYPQSKLLIVQPDQLRGKARAETMSRIATEEWDGVLVSHEALKSLPLSVKAVEATVREEIALLDQTLRDLADDLGEGESIEDFAERATAKGRRRGVSRADTKLVKQIEKQKASLKARLQKLYEQSKRDQTIAFDELGVDMLAVDESHYFNNLFFSTKLGMVAGIANTNAGRAFDLYLKVRDLQRRQGGRGVVFATATPVRNTLAEMYTLFRYLNPDFLKQRGLRHFDNWVRAFATARAALELKPTGSGYRAKTRFSAFVNVPELLTAFRNFSAVMTAEDLKLPVPEMAPNAKGERAPNFVEIQPSKEMRAFVETLNTRAAALKGKGRAKKGEDNMLAVTTDGRKGAIDLTMVGRAAEPAAGQKLDQVRQKVLDIYKRTAGRRGVQAVFLDLSTPDAQPFSAYRWLRDRWVAAGVPAEEVAFAHSFDRKSRSELFGKLNRSEIRIVLGSSKKMGVGANFQTNLVALHNVDVPWTPDGYEQRIGRALRQGNENAEVEIHNYTTKATFDAYMWQTLATKAGFIGQVMTGKASARTMEDVSLTYLTAQEALAATSENPVVVKKIKLEADLRKFERLQGAHQLELYQIGQRRADWERQEVFHTDKARDILDAVRRVGEAKSLEIFDQPGQDPMAPASKTFEKRTDEAGEALKAIIEGIAPGPGTYYVGRYRKFPIWVRRQQAKDAVFTDVRLPTPSRVAELGEQQIVVGTEWRPQYTGSGTGLLQSMEAQAPTESDAQGHAAAAVRKHNEIAKLAVPQFRHSGELERVKRELAEVNEELATEKDDVDAAKMEQEPVDDGGEAAEEADVEAGEDGELEEEGLDEGEVPPVDPGEGGGAGGGRRPPRGPRPPGDDGDATPDGLPSDGPQPGEHGWDRRVREAKARTARRGRGGQANVGVDPMGMGDLAVVGADLVVKGLRRFGGWSREMLRLFGRMIPGLQGMLRGLWNWVRQMFGSSGRGPTPGERPPRAARRPGFEEYRTEFEEATAGQPGAGRQRYPWEAREIPPEEVRRAAEEAARPPGAEPQPAYGKPPKADVNFDRIGGAPDIKEWQARVVESLKPRWGKIRSYRSWAEARESAVRAGLTEQDFIQLVKERGAVTDIEIEAGRMMRQEGAESAFAKLNRLKELQEQRRQTPDDQSKRRLDEEIMEADREYRDALARYVSVTSATVEAASELGRALNIHRKMAEAITPEERFFRQLLRKHPGASEKLQAELADAVMRRDATKIRELARGLYKPGVLDYATEWFVNSLLSGLTTLEVNVLGNLSWEALFRTPERGLAAGLEAAGARQWVERIFGKDPLPRERFGREFEEALRTHYQTRFGALRSLKYAWDFLLNEPQAIGAAGEFRPPAFTGFLGKAIRTPSRMMYALDLGSRWAAMEAEAAVQSVRRAIQESRGSGGWTRDQVTTRMRELQDGYRRYAELDARRQAGEVLAKEDYQYLAKNPMYGRWQQSVKQAGAKATFTDNVDRFSGALLQMREAHPWLTFFAPFIKTPSRILAAALERSPWGAYDTFRKAKAGELRGGELTDAMARVVYGNMIGASLYLLARQGLVTGSGPADPKERATLRKTGWEPYSVKLGDTYVSMARLEPFGTHLGWAADLAEAQNVRGAGELYDKLIQGVSLNIVNKTYLQGAIGLAEAVGDPERYGAAFGRKTLGAFVPNILAQAARAIDPNVRETDTIEGTLLSRVPILSMSLPPQRAGTGEIITREEHPLSRWLNPFRYSVEKGPEANLERIFLDTGYVPQKAPRTVTIPGTGGRKVALTSAERQLYGSYKERATGFARTLAQNEQFLGLEPFQQEELLKRIYRYSHDAAHRAMIASVMQRAADIEWVK